MPSHVRRRTARRPVARRRRARRTAATSNSVGGRLRANARGSTKAISGFPQRMFVTLPYVTTQRTFLGTGDTQTDNVFNINSAYDPDNTGGGHQPRGFDQWAAVYGRYRVHGVKAYLLIRQRAAHGMIGRVILSNSANTMKTTFNLGEYNNATYLGITSTDAPPLKKRMSLTPWGVIGLTKAQYMSDEDVTAVVSSDPAEMAFMHIVTTQVDGTTASDIEFELTLYYRVEFYDRINLGQS